MNAGNERKWSETGESVVGGRLFRKVSEPMALEHRVKTVEEWCKQITARNLQTDLAFVSTRCIIDT